MPLKSGLRGAADGYSLLSNVILGWLVMLVSLLSGFIVKIVAKKRKTVENDAGWDDIRK